MYKFLIGLILVLTCLHASAQEEKTYEPIDFVTTFNLGIHANLNDFYVDFGGGIEEARTKIGAQFNFAFRPFYKKVQINESANVIRQWKEKKFFLSIDLYKRFLPFELGLMPASFIGGVKTGYLFGNYRGTKQKPHAGITLSPFLGISFDLDGIYLQASYLYFNDKLASVPDGRLMLSFLFPINN
jgi:hypothetical protein